LSKLEDDLDQLKEVSAVDNAEGYIRKKIKSIRVEISQIDATILESLPHRKGPGAGSLDITCPSCSDSDDKIYLDKYYVCSKCGYQLVRS